MFMLVYFRAGRGYRLLVINKTATYRAKGMTRLGSLVLVQMLQQAIKGSKL
jgi:hypothetical protein